MNQNTLDKMFKLWREVVECFGTIFKRLVCQSNVYMMIWYPKSVGEHCPELEGCNCKCWGDCSRRGTHFWDISAKSIHPRKLTWIPDMMIWKRWLFFDIFFFGVSGCQTSGVHGTFQREIRQLPPENLKRTPTLPGNLRVPYPPQCHPSPGNSSP